MISFRRETSGKKPAFLLALQSHGCPPVTGPAWSRRRVPATAQLPPSRARATLHLGPVHQLRIARHTNNSSARVFAAKTRGFGAPAQRLRALTAQRHRAIEPTVQSKRTSD